MLTCPSCGRESPEEFAFCPACAAPLAPKPPEREVRKTVTVVFCDVTGSTALGERLDPESLRDVQTRYFYAMRAAIERHGGTVEKYIGDAVMAVFGIPQLHEDDALRAARAAVDMREGLEALNKWCRGSPGRTTSCTEFQHETIDRPPRPTAERVARQSFEHEDRPALHRFPGSTDPNHVGSEVDDTVHLIAARIGDLAQLPQRALQAVDGLRRRYAHLEALRPAGRRHPPSTGPSARYAVHPSHGSFEHRVPSLRSPSVIVSVPARARRRPTMT